MDILRLLWKNFTIKNKLHALIITFLAMSIFSCNSFEQKPLKTTHEVNHHVLKTALPVDPHLSNQINNLLLGELYNQFGKAKLSAKYYQSLIKDSDDPAIVKRATFLAASSGLNKEALVASRLWLDLSPDNLEALQYYSLILLRNNDYENAVDQIHLIYLHVEKEGEGDDQKAVYSKGLKFIGSMLNIESNHDKSLIVFQEYIKKYGNKEEEQQNLILSSLAMNAKKYDIVLSALATIHDEDLKESSKIVLMKVKALKNLGEVNKAATMLHDFIKRKETSDSVKLELVRLLILNNKKESAAPYLKDLVRKYPDNNDLLKSLIALEIDQSQLQSARKNIKKLSKYKDYHSDAAYFSGEISEAEGDIQSALKNYQKVVNGNLKKRAMKKIIKLSKDADLRKVNYKKIPLEN